MENFYSKKLCIIGIEIINVWSGVSLRAEIMIQVEQSESEQRSRQGAVWTNKMISETHR